MLRSQQPPQVHGDTTDVVEASAHDEAVPNTKFSAHGSIPPVHVQGTGDHADAPSASDRAFGHHETGSGGPQLDGPAHLRVTVSALNVRSAPDKTADNVIGGLHRGAKVDAVSREGEWVRIHHDGKHAFVFAAFLELVRPEAAGHDKAKTEQLEDNAASTDEKDAAAIAKPHLAKAPHATASPDITPMFEGIGALADATTLLAAEYQRLIGAVEQGHMDQSTAVSTFVAFDQQHHAGNVSASGTQMVGPLTGAVAAAGATHAAQQAAAAPATTATTATVAAPPPAAKKMSTEHEGYATDDTSYMHAYHHIEGGGALDDDAVTDKTTEAPVLNAIRDDRKKFEPVYLESLQDKLGVVNKSGAFNTETLRKLRAHYKTIDPKKKVDAHAILDGHILTAIVPGTPFRDMGDGYGAHAKGTTGERAAGASKPDAMAKALGFADWAEMDGAMVPISLLGKSLGRGLPHLAAKVQLADEWLRARYPKPAGKDWKTHAKDELGWNYSGNAAYGDNAAEIAMANGTFSHGHAVGAHVHSAGLALDIDVHHNPYVFSGNTDAKGQANDTMATHLRYAVQLYGGEAVSPSQLYQWSQELSTEELFAKVDKASQALDQYLDLCNASDEKIIAEFETRAGFTHDQAVAVVPHVRQFGQDGHKNAKHKSDRFWQDNVNRDEAHGLMTHSMPLLVALRDVAGLAWGGAEISEHGNNGDFMHFDCRNEGIGSRLLSFGHANHGSDADHTPEAIQARAAAAAEQHDRRR